MRGPYGEAAAGCVTGGWRPDGAVLHRTLVTSQNRHYVNSDRVCRSRGGHAPTAAGWRRTAGPLASRARPPRAGPSRRGRLARRERHRRLVMPLPDTSSQPPPRRGGRDVSAHGARVPHDLKGARRAVLRRAGHDRDHQVESADSHRFLPAWASSSTIRWVSSAIRVHSRDPRHTELRIASLTCAHRTYDRPGDRCDLPAARR